MTGRKLLKRQKLRNNEYYDMQSVFDELYENSLAKCEFKNLISIITAEENIRLAYRNLKKNAGSRTPGTDGKTIADLAKMSEPELIGFVQQKFNWYQPQSVRRKEIPKGKRNQYVVISHIAPKALDRIKETAKKKVKAIQHSSGEMEEFKAVSDYNSFVMGIHNYYRMATAASPDIQRLAFEIKISIKNRLQERVRRRSNQTIPEYAKRYARSREIRFIGKNILLPIGYIQHHPPIHKKKSVNKYTAAGRAEIHKNLECVDMSILHSLMKNPITSATVEYNDNRISLYVAQQGKCAITKKQLSLEEIHCHHKKPKSLGGGDEYANLIILHERIHRLVHATQEETISAIMQTVQLNKQQLDKLNKLRKLAGIEAITLEQQDTCC